jgi:hypothetical protein
MHGNMMLMLCHDSLEHICAAVSLLEVSINGVVGVDAIKVVVLPLMSRSAWLGLCV